MAKKRMKYQGGGEVDPNDPNYIEKMLKTFATSSERRAFLKEQGITGKLAKDYMASVGAKAPGEGKLAQTLKTAGELATGQSTVKDLLGKGAGEAGKAAATTAATEATKGIAGQAAGIGGSAGIGLGAKALELGVDQLMKDESLGRHKIGGKTAKGALEGAAKGATYGSVIPGFGTVAGAIGGAVYGGVKEFIGAKKEKKERLKEESGIAAQAAALGSGRYKDGGQIQGKGGPKSDSIKGNIEEESFVVPAENAGIAKRLRNKYLGGPLKKANVNQKGGKPVAVSNGEHLFTPEEVAILKSKGVNLNALAPNAKKGNKYQDGGTVKERRAEIAGMREQAQALQDKIDTAERLGPTIDEKKQIHQWKQQKKALVSDASKKEYALDLEQGISIYNFQEKKARKAAEEIKGELAELDAKVRKMPAGAEKQAVLDQIDALKDERVSYLEIANDSKKARDYAEGFRELPDSDDDDHPIRISQRIAELPRTQPDPTEKPVATEDLIDPALDPDALGEEPNGEEVEKGREADRKSKGQGKGAPASSNQNQAVTDAERAVWDRIKGRYSEERIAAEDKLKNQLYDLDALDTQLSPKVIDPDTQMVHDPNRTGTADPETGEKDPTKIGALGALGVGQLVAGTASALTDERPEDKIGPEISERYRRAVADEKFGLDPATRAILRNQIEQTRANTAKNIIEVSGGQRGMALANMRATNLGANQAYIQAASADAQERQRKAARTDSLAGIIEGRRAQIFQYDLRAFEQRQEASAALIHAGMANIAGGIELEQEKAWRKEQEADKLKSQENLVKQFSDLAKQFDELSKQGTATETNNSK